MSATGISADGLTIIGSGVHAGFGNSEGWIAHVPAACVTPADCPDDGIVCTTATCIADACGVSYNALPCGDGLFCNGTDTCAGGSCSIHSGDPCPGGSCNEISDACLYGDLTGDGVVDLDDILCLLDDFDNLNTCSGNGDIFPCGGGDGIIDLSDILSVLDAFGGSFAC